MSTDQQSGPPFTVPRYGSLGEAIVAERDWLRAENERLREAIALYVDSKKSHLGRNAQDWWRLQEIAKESAHTRSGKHGD